MRFHYTPPRKKIPRRLDFSLESLRFLAMAVDSSVPSLLLRHAKGSDLTPEEEAKAVEFHENARKGVLALLAQAGEVNPLVFLAMGLERSIKGGR